MNEIINIITRCSRTKNLLRIKDSIFNSDLNFRWYITFDTSILKDISVELLLNLQDTNIILSFDKSKQNYFVHYFIKKKI